MGRQVSLLCHAYGRQRLRQTYIPGQFRLLISATPLHSHEGKPNRQPTKRLTQTVNNNINNNKTAKAKRQAAVH